MAVIFDKCCFCIDLRTGCLIIGYLNLIGNVVLSFIVLAMFGKLVAIVDVAAQEKDVETQQMGSGMLVIIGIVLVVFLLYLAFCIVLLVGLHKYKRGHIKAYLIYALFFIMLSAVKVFASFYSSPIDVEEVVISLLSWLLNIYFLLVINSYYHKMDNPANRPAIYHSA